MGRGIVAAVPLVFLPYARYGKQEKIEKEYFSKGFFDNFDILDYEDNEIKSGGVQYVIKTDLLLNNYKDFLLEFYDLIEEDFKEETDMERDDIPDANYLDEFWDVFSRDNRNGRAPYVEAGNPFYNGFSTLGGKCPDFWTFYSGSYKADLEVYSTLQHFEKILAKAMKNPLANAVKFAIYG